MPSRFRLFLGLLVILLPPALGASDSWLDGEALMLNMLGTAALHDGVMEQFHPDCRIALDGVMASHVTLAGESPAADASRCRRSRHWESVRQYLGEFRSRNDTTARFMRPSGIGAPWMVRYAVRCRRACDGDMVGFEIRFTYDGRQVTRVELQAR